MPAACARAMQGWFLFWTMFMTTLSMVPVLLLLAPCGIWRGSAKRCVGTTCGYIVHFFWRLALLLCPWIAVRQDGWGRWREVGASSRRPVAVLSNHIAWIDVMLLVAYCPIIGRFRALAAASLWKIPMLGTLCRALSHVKVHFKDARTDGSSSSLAVDSSKANEMDAQLRELIGGGLGLAFYPEGQLNKGDPRQLQPLRYGGFRYLVEFDMEIWAVITVGHHETWPLLEPVGGLPARIKHSLICVAPEGALKLIGKSASEDLDSESRLLAARAQEIMQAELDRLWREKDSESTGGYQGLNSGDPAS